FEEHKNELIPYGLERPLWVFVGGSVTQRTSKAEGTDIHRIVRFLTRFVSDQDESQANIARLLSGDSGLVASGRDTFAGKFAYLRDRHTQADQILPDLMDRIFNTATGGHLRIEELKGADG